MEETVTVNWINCCCKDLPQIKKISDLLESNHLIEILIRSQYCNETTRTLSAERKRQIIVDFLNEKIPSNNIDGWFRNENLLLMCWVFLIHIVWAEETTLRNNLSSLNNASQVFIKIFLESIGDSVVTVLAVTLSLRRAAERNYETSPESAPKANVTPQCETPTGPRRRSVTLREYFQSPNAQKKRIEEYIKKIEQLKLSLNAETEEKDYILEEKNALILKMENITKLSEKRQREIEKLKEDNKDLEQTLNESMAVSKTSVMQNERVADLKLEIGALKKYITELEKKNEKLEKKTETLEKTIQQFNEEFVRLNKQYSALEVTLMNKEEVLKHLQVDRDFFKGESSNFKEYNKALIEKIEILEKTSSSLADSKDNNLEREIQFAMMKDNVESMAKNMKVIQTEQSRILCENEKLAKNLEITINAKEDSDKRINVLTGQLHYVENEKRSLENELQKLSKKFEKSEETIATTRQQFEEGESEYKRKISNLRDEKADVERAAKHSTLELEKYTQLCDEYCKREKRISEENATLNENVKGLRNELCKMESVNKEQKRTLDDLENRNKNVNAQNESLIEKTLETEKRLQEFKKENKTVVGRMKCENAKLKTQNEALTETVAKKEIAMLELSQRNDTVTYTLQQKEARLKEMETKYETDLNRARKDYENEISIAHADLDRCKSDLKSTLEKYSEELDRINQLSGSNETYLNNLREKEDLLKEAVTRAEALEKRKSDLEECYQKETNTNDRLTKEIAEMQQIIVEHECLRRDHDNLNAEHQSVLQRLTASNEELQKMKEEGVKVRNANLNLTKQLEKYRQQMEEKKKEAYELVKTLEAKETEILENNDRTEKEINQALEEHERDTEKLTCLVEECATLREVVGEQSEAKAKLEKRCEELEESKTTSLNELRDMYLYQIEHSLNENEVLKSQNLILQETNKEKVWYLGEIQKRVEPILSAAEDLERKLAEVKSENRRLADELAECNDGTGKLREKIAQLTNETQKRLKEKAELGDQVNSLNQDKEQLKRNVQSLMAEMEKMRKDDEKVREMESYVREMEKRSALNEESLEARARKLEHVSAEKETLVRRTGELKNKIDESVEQNEQLTKELRMKNAQYESIVEENEKLLLKLNETRENTIVEEFDKLLEQNEHMCKTNAELSDKLDKANGLLTEKVAEMAKLNGKYDTLKQEYRKLNDHKEELDNEYKNMCKTNAELSGDLNKANGLLTEKVAEMAKLDGKYDALKQEYRKLSDHREELDNECKNMGKTNAELSGKLEKANGLLAEKDAEMVKLNGKYDTLKQEYHKLNDHKEELDNEYKNMCKTNAELSGDLDKVNGLLNEKVAEMAKLDGKYDALKQEYEIFKQEYRKLSDHKEELDNECKKTLLKQVEQLQGMYDDAEKQLTEKTNEIEILQAKVVEQKHMNKATGDLEAKSVVLLQEENAKLLAENNGLEQKMSTMEANLRTEKDALRNKSQNLYETLNKKLLAEYEGKLERAKVEYNKLLMKKLTVKETEWKKKEETFKGLLNKDKDNIKDLSSQLWDINDKYLSMKQKYESQSSIGPSYRRYSIENIFSPTSLSRRTQSATHLNLLDSRNQKDFSRRLSTMSEDIQLHGKKKPSSTISGKKFALSSAKVFPTADEDMEIFDNAYLADLKQGCFSHEEHGDSINKQRLSVLQARNSLCPPHLKSSYPGETQFLPLQEFKENDIKLGLTSGAENSELETLLPGDKTKKSRNQTTYKKPGPPTPGKNGGRSLSNIGSGETPRNVLKESNSLTNSVTARRKSFTPKILDRLFSVRGHATVTIPPGNGSQQHSSDENVNVTPRRTTRLQSIRRRFSKPPPELGNTNSGFC